ncbi:MAG: hypothetical protein IM613_12840 [Cytophagales bacterium]|nr:hypothetical protein [Cytophagales bacterium]
MYNIEAGNKYGEALLALIQDEYETVDDGLYTIAAVLQAEGLDVDDEDIVAIIEAGEIELEQEEFDAIASVFDQTQDEDVYNGLLATAMDAAGMLDLDDALDTEDDSYDEYETVEEEYVEPVGAYSASQHNTASFSAGVDPRVAALEARLATVETFSVVKDRLANINAKAEFGVQEGWLPPVAKEALVANFNREEDMVASFSMLASKNGVDLDTQLHAMEFALELFKRCGNLVDFNQYVSEDIDPVAEQRAYEVDAAAKRSLQAIGLFK